MLMLIFWLWVDMRCARAFIPFAADKASAGSAGKDQLIRGEPNCIRPLAPRTDKACNTAHHTSHEQSEDTTFCQYTSICVENIDRPSSADQTTKVSACKLSTIILHYNSAFSRTTAEQDAHNKRANCALPLLKYYRYNWGCWAYDL